MNARMVQQAETELRELRWEARWDWVVAALALAMALVASRYVPELALPLLVAGIAVGARGARALWRRWDLVDRLLPQRDAYLIDEIRTQAHQLAAMKSRHELAESIRLLLAEPESVRPAAATALAEELEALAGELDNEALVLDPACAVACRALLTTGDSPLFGATCSVENVRARIRHIRCGFECVCAAA